MRPDFDTYFENELNYAILISFIVGLMWLTFVANLFLLFACCKKNRKLLDLYIFLTILNICVSVVLTMRYLIYCTVFDNICFDHAKDREGNDVGASFALLLLCAAYVVLLLLVVFAVCNFKLAMRRNSTNR